MKKVIVLLIILIMCSCSIAQASVNDPMWEVSENGENPFIFSVQLLDSKISPDKDSCRMLVGFDSQAHASFYVYSNGSFAYAFIDEQTLEPFIYDQDLKHNIILRTDTGEEYNLEGMQKANQALIFFNSNLLSLSDDVEKIEIAYSYNIFTDQSIEISFEVERFDELRSLYNEVFPKTE